MYLVTDTGQCGGPAGVVETARQAADGGVDAVQVRDPHATTRELVALATAVREALAGTGVPLIINDRVDVALAVGADGVHLGQRDLDPVTARALFGPDVHIGLSISDERELTEALGLPAGTVDLLGVGPVRDTPSKTDAAPAVGFDGLAAICRRSPVPCVAIGGIKGDDLAAVRAAGAVGAAVISAICGRPDPTAAARALSRGWAAAVPDATGSAR
ncbi:thiamine phosphate synthase [Nakamurella sp. YIM 132084]|uniref:Thiamine-phosphate synthase n=1 Tax=Nakamurella leprariae TaxID=2803911 RepID=A0A939BZE3_9ACTN|nr:thiamine phosphate synthase [Nakamurella leprariae]